MQQSTARRQASLAEGILLSLLTAAVFASVNLPRGARAAEMSESGPPLEAQIEALTPGIETYTAGGMKTFASPGLALGIVANDRLVYAKGFGVRSKTGGEPVDTRTVFQIGSTTKAFLATTLAIMVDRDKLRWDDRVVDLDPDFQLKDPWVTREFRVFDLLAQRSGLPPYANDALGLLGLAEPALIRSLRYVEPASSFRSTFAYTNITHLLAGRVVAKAAGAADGDGVLRQELLEPLGMKDSSYTAEAIENQQATTMGAVLENNPSVRSISAGAMWDTFMIRGFQVSSSGYSLNGCPASHREVWWRPSSSTVRSCFSDQPAC